MKIGIFGGTFDPWHEGHEAIVKKALDEKLVDKVIVVPTVVNYYRDENDKWLGDDDKIKLLQCRVKYLSELGYRVSCDCRELEALRNRKSADIMAYRKGRRFYHTLTDFIDDINEWHVIIGSDQFANFKKWFMWEYIVKLSRLIVVQGRGHDTVVSDIPHVEITIDEKYADVSATDIRKRYKGTEDALSRYVNGLPKKQSNDEAELIQHTPIFDLVRKHEVQPGFRPVGINAPDWVMVVVLNDWKFIMVKQLRYGIMQELTEFPCGQVDRYEMPYDAAIRELREETGIENVELEYLGSFYTNPAFMNNRIHFYFADITGRTNVVFGKPKPDEHEKLTVSWEYVTYVLKNITYNTPAFKRIAIDLASRRIYG